MARMPAMARRSTLDLLVLSSSNLLDLDPEQSSSDGHDSDKEWGPCCGSRAEPAVHEATAGRPEQPEAEPAPEPERARAPRARPGDVPDFSGVWVCCGVEGDWEAYLKETGVAWGARKAIASMGFGVGTQQQEVTHTDGLIEVVNVIRSLPPREARAVYRINGAWEATVDLEGKPAKSLTSWEGGALVTQQQLDSPRTSTTARRFMRGELMCTERSTASGLVVGRLYRRR